MLSEYAAQSLINGLPALLIVPAVIWLCSTVKRMARHMTLLPEQDRIN